MEEVTQKVKKSCCEEVKEETEEEKPKKVSTRGDPICRIH